MRMSHWVLLTLASAAYWQLGMGFMYQYNTWSETVAAANDIHISQMHSRGFYLADYMIDQDTTARNIPWRTIWAQIHREYPSLNPLRDGTGPHVNYDLREAVGTYMYTLYSGRCPLDPEPSPVTAAWDAKRIGYETAWMVGRCASRAPGFKVLPSAADALSITQSTDETMSVQFILQPLSNVTVNVSISNPAATVSPAMLTFTPANYATAQSVTVSGLPGPVASEDFNVNFVTASADEACNGVTDSWKYSITRTDLTTGAASNPAPAQLATDVSTPDVMLSWTAGAGATSHQVYLGTIPSPGAGQLQETVTGTTFNATGLLVNTTYYWRIAAVGPAGTTLGPVWSFTTEVDANDPPVLDPIDNKSVDESDTLAITLSATDPDNNLPLSYSATGLPTGATLDASSGAFSWTPGWEQQGAYEVTFRVTDSLGGFDEESIEITVNDIDDDTDGDGIRNDDDPDGDSDGMPDGWEVDNGLDPDDAADASGDADGDGVSRCVITNQDSASVDPRQELTDARAPRCR